MSDLVLYGYQEEVVQRALQGENIIVCLPTGAGKTRAAVFVVHKHLQKKPGAKVVVLVNTVHLVDQHYSKEFRPALGRHHVVTAVSSDSDRKDFLGLVLRDTDVLVCTAQILLNALVSKAEAKRVELSDITLLVVDECHHTHKETVYNKIMRLYLKKKMRKDEDIRLPQVLGLTASPGSAGAKSLDKAVQHVLQICANLDCAIVCTKKCIEELNMQVPKPVKRFDIVEKRQEDPFGDHVQSIMRQIHNFMQPPEDFTLREFGTQDYESDMVALQKRGVEEYDRRLRQCAIHLREYNDALMINDTLLMEDALRSLKAFYRGRETTIIDNTDRFLVNLFQENEAKLMTLARDMRYTNPKMEQLERVLTDFFPSVQSRGIVFSKTRKSTSCLHQWVLAKDHLRIKSAIITGSAGMTQQDRDRTIQKFRQGSVNLLIATSVAEEGLDIPQCNLVVRYGLLTNEIAQQQASGRARAQDSYYSLVAERGGPEERREHLNTYLAGLTARAVDKIHQMSPTEFRAKIDELQAYAMSWNQMVEFQMKQKNGCYLSSRVQLLCGNCLTAVARGSDIKLLDDMHYVNVNPQFRRHYKKGPPILMNKTFEDWEPGCSIMCNNGNCNQKWGYEKKFHKVALLPNVAIRNFALQTPGGRTTVKKWKDVPFIVERFRFGDDSD